MRYFLSFLFLFGFYINTFGQSFPSPASLSTGQGPLGTNDPNWQVSQQCYATATAPNPTNVAVTYSPAVILSSRPTVWINPASLPAPVNNGNWIGVSATAGNDDAGGCSRYYRLPINLPANCGTVSVTNAGAYTLTFDGYVDNTLMEVYLNGVNQGVTAGGSFAAGTQLTFTLPGPWLVGVNYIDVLVENGVSVPPNPAGFLMVASPSTASNDSDGDGINNLNDVCACDAGTLPNGCVAPNNQCNIAAIQATFTAAGCTELTSCFDGCSMYFLNPTNLTHVNAQSFAQNLGANLVSFQSITENNCIGGAIGGLGFSTAIIGYGPNPSNTQLGWYDGSQSPFTNWSPGDPNGGEFCPSLTPSGSWADRNCGSYVDRSVIEVGLCPQATINTNTLHLCRGASTTLTVSTLFGSAPYSYTWTPNIGLSSNTSSNPIASPSVTTNYTVQSTDRYGCTTYAYVTLTVSPTPTITANFPTICRGLQTATLIANGANTYSWAPATGLSATTGSMVTGTPSATTIYTVTGTNSAGCTSYTATFIKVDNIPNITVASSNSAICFGQQSSNLSAGGALSYTWMPATGLSATTGANVVASPITSTTYTIAGINGFGCPNFTTTTIIVNPLPIINVNDGSDPSICLGQQTATLTASGATTYDWAPPLALNTLTGSVVLANPTANTTYSILGVDDNGCVNLTTRLVKVLPLPIVSSNSASICIGQQSATLTALGALSYSWFPPTNLSSSSGSVVVANPTVNTTYTVVGVDINGCYNYSLSIVSMNALPNIVVNSPSICIGQQTATLIANGADTYSWIPNTNLSATTGSVVSATPSITTTYTIEGTDINGCINTTTNTVTLLPLPLLSANDASICMGQQTATLTANGADTYTWLPTLSTGSVATVMPLIDETFTVVGTDAMGCMNYTISNVTVYTLPIISVNDTSICIGQQTATLIAYNGISYTWSPATDLSSSTGSLVTTSPTATSIYTVIGTDTNGCYNDTNSTVTVYELPIIIVNSSSVCPGQFPANLLPIGASTYTWEPTVTYNQPDGSDVDANPAIPTDYTVTGVDIYGCYNTATTNVGFYEIPTASLTVNDSILCLGDSFVLTPSGGTSFQLLPDNTFSLDDFTVTPQSTSGYTLVVFSDDGCFSINDPAITITVNPLPTITAFTNTVVNIGQTTSINASGGVTYVWNPTNGLTCSTCAPTNARPLENTTYTVTGYDANGCASTNTVYVQVDYICGDYFVPNVFSPNGDGVNDLVNLHSACVATYTLQIFDRWGEKVFETSDINNSWNGTFRGKAMDTGVFVYQANGFDLKGNSFSVKGNVTLLR